MAGASDPQTGSNDAEHDPDRLIRSAASPSSTSIPSSSSGQERPDPSRSDEQKEASDSNKLSKNKAGDTLRRSQACLACRKRKLRCDAKKPTCTRCEKAWHAYNVRTDSRGLTTSAPPPCEYDASFLTKIFKRPPSPASTPVASTSRDTLASPDARTNKAAASLSAQQLLEDNERLREQIAYLQTQVDRSMDLELRQTSSDTSFRRPHDFKDELASHRLSVSRLIDDGSSAKTSKRRRSSADHSSAMDGSDERRHSVPPNTGVLQQDALDRTRYYDEAQVGSSLAPKNIVHDADRLALGPGSPKRLLPGDGMGRMEISSAVASRLPALTEETPPPLPDTSLVFEIVVAFSKAHWPLQAANAYVLESLPSLAASSTRMDIDGMVAKATLMAVISVGLLYVPSAVGAFQALLRDNTVPNRKAQEWAEDIPSITRAYASGAKLLLRRASELSKQVFLPETFAAQVLLVRFAYCNLSTREAQEHLASAIVQSRLVGAHDQTPGMGPRMEQGMSRKTQLSLALANLIQERELILCFWFLFMQDIIQNKLRGWPALIDRDSIRTVFPYRFEIKDRTSVQHSQEEVIAYLRKKSGLPKLGPQDNSMCLLVKAAMVLDSCCDFAVQVRSRKLLSRTVSDLHLIYDELRQGQNPLFRAVNDELRNLRIVLTQFDNRTVHSNNFNQSVGSGRHGEPPLTAETLMLRDLARFGAEIMEHGCVLCLFECLTNLENPFDDDKSRGVMQTAASWLSRLAGMALREGELLISMSTFCASAFLMAARWLIWLEVAEPGKFQFEISVLAAALWKRARSFSNDVIAAKAIIALIRERDVYGRVCVSPYTWPVDVISDFIPIPRMHTMRSRQIPASPAIQVSITSLCSSVQDFAVEELAHFSSTL